MSRNQRKIPNRLSSAKPTSNSQPQLSISNRTSCAEICQICMQVFVEPYSAVCGHTFCRACIIRHTNLSNPNHLIPNHTAAALIENARRTRQSIHSFKRLASEINQELNQDYGLMEKMISPLDTADSIDKAILTLKRRRTELTLNEEKKKSILLNEFFDQMIAKRNETIAQSVRELELLKVDKKRVNDILKCTISPTSFCRIVPDSESALSQSDPQTPSSSIENEQIRSLKKRIQPSMRSLETCYFETQQDQQGFDELQQLGSLGQNLEKFSNVLTGISKFAKIRRVATLNYPVESFPSSSIVSSIEFDKDGELFVVAGVSNKIKVHNFNSVAYGDSKSHFPLTQLQCSSKISNVSYNPVLKNLLSSSDYDGHVRLWDTDGCRSIRTFSEHEKRCWTVQFNHIDPQLMASGSDDAKLKIWSINEMHSVATIDAKVNVCCVYFSPSSKHHFVFGSADHCVHLYDLRNTSRSVNTFCGHLKAVSYVKYCNENEIVSASVDSTLRLWDVKTGTCKQVMRGHQNEKNFVGLATDGNHIVCGSENNHLYTYYKNISDPLLRYNFDTRQTDPNTSELSLMSNEQNPGSDFVSAVCWRKNSNIVVSASSQGSTHVLELI
ncbi:E3 ubiquitin-protein ligase RFWD2 [Aphelenchoides bicaudatus]|nr:E3 ubiquitin-protein ligase RFWD2 [Aphelenchoides bicaudatus]